MKVLGTVKDAATEVPLPDAKIRLYVREEELAVLQSDSEGTFEHESESQYLGEILICKVEKAGYEPQKVIQEFEEDEVTLAIKLVPLKEEKIEFTVNLKDEKRTPLKGVNVSLELDGEGVGVGISDKDGIFKITLSPDFEGKTINYKAELGGFELASGAVLLKKETSHEITMKKITMKKPPAQPPNRKWLKIAAVVAGIAIVILAVMIISSSVGPKNGSIYVASTPSGASVYLDGSYKGTTPKTITGVSAGSHTIKLLSMSGPHDHSSRSIRTSVKAGEKENIYMNFQATIYVTSTPSGASVYLDGSYNGTTPKTIKVSAGDYTIRLSKSGYQDYTKTTSVLTDEIKRINANLILRVEPVDIEVPQDKPEIKYLKASPSKIKPDESATLSWDVSDASNVNIEPGIGRVNLKGEKRVFPTESTTYTITATNEAGKDVDTTRVNVAVVVQSKRPVIKYLKASPSKIKPDESATLTWDVSDATRVTIEPGIGRVNLKGEKRVFPTESTTYTITATNEAGKDVDTTRVNVAVVVQSKRPVIKYLKASPSKIKPDESATLTWDVSDATRVTIEPGIGRVNLKGEKRVFPTESTTYTITATNEAGKDVDTTRVKVAVVVQPEKPVIKYFTAGDSKLSWSVSDAASVTIEPGIGKVALRKTKKVSPTKTTTYTLTATNDAGSVDATVKVIVEIREDCINFNYQQAEVQQIKGRWKIVVDSMWLMDFDNNEAEARKALEIIKHYDMNSQCFVGRPDPSMEYYLVSGQTPTGYFSGEDCISFNQATIEVKQVNKRWKIVDGNHYILDFETKEDEARTAFNIIKKYEFNRICFVGRPDPSMTYFRST